MDYNLLARTAKAVALFGFFLPWVLVSCSGNEIASATGLQLMTGHVTLQGPLASQPPPDATHPAVLVIVAFAAAAIGLLASFLLRRRNAALVLLIAALLSAGATGVAMQNLHEAVAREASGEAHSKHRPVSDDGSQLSERAQRGITQAVARMVRVEERPGYWTTLGALLAAAGLALAGLAKGPAVEQTITPSPRRKGERGGV